MNLCVCVCVATMFWNPDRTVRSNRKNREPLTITVLLCSRTGLCQKCREPFEPRFNHTVLRTVIEPLLMVPLNLNLKKKKKKTQKKRKRNTTPSSEKQINTTPSQKKKKKYIMFATAISRETHVFMFLLLLSSEHITQLPLLGTLVLGEASFKF